MEENVDESFSELLNDINQSFLIEAIEKSLNQNIEVSLPPRDQIFTSPPATPHRCGIRVSGLKYLKIFPWFHLNTDTKKFRENLNPNKGVDIDQVYSSLYYMWRPYQVHEIEFLRDLYLKLNYSKIKCLTAIIDVQDKFKIYCDSLLNQSLELLSNDNNSIQDYPTDSEYSGSHSPYNSSICSPISHSISFDHNSTLEDHNSTLYNHKSILDNHETRIEVLEKKLDDGDLVGGKRVRRGGDRARWMRIRDEDLPTREKWCVPGGVFGYYAEGIGPLVPVDQRPRQGIVVYSTDPDTVEEHPDSKHENCYARIVMIGEAPVKLHQDQYAKLQRLKCNVNIYANHLGDICIRELHKQDPTDGIIFATTDWSDNYATDSEGYPTFQGVRGVCASIIPYNNQKSTTQFGTALTNITRQISRTFLGSPKSQHSPNSVKSQKLIDLQQQKDEVNRELAELESSHEIFNECKVLKQSLHVFLSAHQNLLLQYRRLQVDIPKSKPIYSSLESFIADDLISTLTQKNCDIQNQINQLNSLSSTNKEQYTQNKEKLEKRLETIKAKIKKEKSKV